MLKKYESDKCNLFKTKDYSEKLSVKEKWSIDFKHPHFATVCFLTKIVLIP